MLDAPTGLSSDVWALMVEKLSEHANVSTSTAQQPCQILLYKTPYETTLVSYKPFIWFGIKTLI